MRIHTLAILACLASFGAAAADSPPKVTPPGDKPTGKTHALKSGAALLQTDAPVSGMDVYLVGFHAMKDQPEHQMESHHFCRQVNEDFAQCALFDGNTAQANLTGIEFIISEKLFESLPEDERKHWHPHNYEILSGQLVAPNIPAVAEKELMKGKMNSYGKTWHVWATDQGQSLPLGPAMLAWSFNRQGEEKPELVEERDRRFKTSTEEKRRQREELTGLAKPQSGVDDLKGKFARPAQPLAGVVDRKSASTGGSK